MTTTAPLRRLTAAWSRFFASQSAGGIVLALAALIALVLSNSGWG